VQCVCGGTKTTVLATKGILEARWVLIDLANIGNSAAKDALRLLNPKPLIDLAAKGDPVEMQGLRDLAEYGNSMSLSALIDFSAKGNIRAAWALIDLAHRDNSAAKDVLRSLNPQPFIDLATNGNSEAARGLGVASLVDLADRGNSMALSALIDLATKGNKESVNWLNDYSNSQVLRLRQAHLEERVSDAELDQRLTQETKNNPFLLYVGYTSPENFGDLAKKIMSRLTEQARKEGKDLNSFLRALDPKGVFYKDFILQAANFSQLNEIVSTPQALYEVMDLLFKDSSRATVEI